MSETKIERSLIFTGNAGNKIKRRKMRMNKRIALKILTGLLLSLAIAGVVLNCGKKSDSAASRAMVVVFAVGEAKIVRAGKEIGAQVGMVVSENDQIKTTDGSVDLQTKSGSAVRIRPFTTITVARLAGGEETKLSMDHGGLLANVKRTSNKETFSVVTPTAIAGVRGTTFSMDVEEGQRPTVKVLDGSVAMAPRIPALDNYTPEQIQANPSLKQLEAVQHQEVVIEEKTEGTLDPKVEQQVIQANAAIETAVAQNPTATPDQLNGNLAKAAKIAEEIKAGPATITTQAAEITARDISERDTLVTVDSSTLEKVVANADKGDTTAVDEMRKEQEAKQNVVLQRIQDQAQKVELKTEQEIRQHYNSLETIVMKNGDKLSGAVIAQTGDQLVVHTANGVVRVRRADVASQEF